MSPQKKPSSYLLTLLFLLLSGSQVASQDLQLAGVSFGRFFPAEVEASAIDQVLGFNEYNAFLNIPIQLKNEKTVLVNGFQYALVRPFGDNDLNQDLDLEGLHYISYRLTIVQQLRKDWSFIAVLNPALSSTFNTALEGEDVIFSGVLMASKKQSERLSYGFGVAQTFRFGRPLVLPVLELTHRSEKSKSQVLFPRLVSFDYYFGKLSVGALAAVNGSEYNANYVRTLPLVGTQESVDKVGYTRLTLGPTIGYRIGKMLKLDASGGIVPFRRVEFRSDVVDDEDSGVENAPFLRVGIALVPPGREE